MFLYPCLHADAQLGGLGGPPLNITFGEAATDNLSIPGPPLPLGFTAIPYSKDVCPPPGFYSVVSGMNLNCFNKAWIPMFSDNTPFPDNNGYMMLINDLPSASPKTVFRDTVRDICSDVNYQFSAAIINVSDPAAGCNRFSSLTLVVEDNLGNLIGSTTTGDIQFAQYSMGYHFAKYVVDFMVPAGVSGIVVKIIDNPKSGATTCSNGIAIDDIQVAVTGPKVNIGFDSTPTGDWVKSACFQDNKSFSMNGTIDPGITNPQVQWQQSTDDGLTWTDIPGATGYSYSRSFSVADTFLFRLRASDPAHISFPTCGIASNLLKVQVNGIPANFAITNNSPICAGQDLIFNAEGGASYQWWGPNGFTETAPYAHIYHSTLADSGRYYVKIISEGGCTAIDSTDVVMLGTDIHLNNDTAICKGHTVVLQASGGISYQWLPVKGLSNPSISNPKASPESTTTYTVKVKDIAGCSNTGSVTVKILNTVAVQAKFASPGFICRDDGTASFTDQSLGNIINWNWDFNNGQTSTVANPPVQYYSMANNSYTISLAVMDSAGCADTVYQQLKVADNCHIAVPTAFSPNGDGINDYLYPLNAYRATHLIFNVYNRNGQLIFQTKDWTKKWDGSLHGRPQDPGAYVWTLQYTDEKNKAIFLKGTTILIR